MQKVSSTEKCPWRNTCGQSVSDTQADSLVVAVFKCLRVSLKLIHLLPDCELIYILI